METQGTEEQTKRLQALAERLDCLTSEDLRILAGIEASTEEAWRKRGTGPAFVRVGTNFLYPRASVATWLHGRVKKPRQIAARDLL